MKASDKERFYQCLTCKFTEVCNLDEKAEDERGLCKKYQLNKIFIKGKDKKD